jgi:hypothetical protein|tara:strand:+ start:1059 stop:1244 length:186 start_codon:yes stop_codon:yes gene_type:complete
MLKSTGENSFKNPCDFKYHELFSCINNSLSNDDIVKETCIKLHEDYNQCVQNNLKKQIKKN